MIRSQDLGKELVVLEDKIKTGKVENADVLKAITLLVKVARDIRSNQVTIMKHEGINLRTREVSPDTDKE